MARKVRCERWVIRLTLVLIVGVVAAGCNLSKPQPKSTSKPTPKQVRYLATLTTGHDILAKSTPAGNWMLEYTVREKARRLLGITLYDWEGRVCRRFKVPGLSYRSIFRDDITAFSSDGLCAALALPEVTQVHLLTWRAGKPVTDTRLPMRSPYALLLAIENSGRLWYVDNSLPTGNLYALDGNRVIATGTYTSTLKAPPGSYLSQALAPDGGILATYREDDEGRRIPGPDLEYAALQVSGNRITLINRYAWKAVGGHLLNDGLMVADGTTYNVKGRMSRKTRLNCGGTFGNSILMIDDLLGKWFVLNPGAKLRWQIPADFKIYGISSDGRAAAGYQESDQGTQLNIYQYPGPLCASLRLDDHRYTGPLHWVRKILDEGPPRWVKTTLQDERGKTLSTRDLFLSPDGRRVVLKTFDNEDHLAFYLFGW